MYASPDSVERSTPSDAANDRARELLIKREHPTSNASPHRWHNPGAQVTWPKPSDDALGLYDPLPYTFAVGPATTVGRTAPAADVEQAVIVAVPDDPPLRETVPRYVTRLFDRRGSDVVGSSLQHIERSDVPEPHVAPPPSLGAADYFRSSARGLRPNTLYYVELFVPGECTLPIDLGTLRTRSL
jgi:hypothetical protein